MAKEIPKDLNPIENIWSINMQVDKQKPGSWDEPESIRHQWISQDLAQRLTSNTPQQTAAVTKEEGQHFKCWLCRNFIYLPISKENLSTAYNWSSIYHRNIKKNWSNKACVTANTFGHDWMCGEIRQNCGNISHDFVNITEGTRRNCTGQRIVQFYDKYNHISHHKCWNRDYSNLK